MLASAQIEFHSLFLFRIFSGETSPRKVATEVCDASPGYIEKNGAWLSSPGAEHCTHNDVTRSEDVSEMNRKTEIQAASRKPLQAPQKNKKTKYLSF